MRIAPLITCACGCGRTGHHIGRGLVAYCYKRFQADGTLRRYPRRPMDEATRAAMARMVSTARARYGEGRLEDYVELREWGETRRAAEARLDVTRRTTTRWHSYLRAAGYTYRWLPALPSHLTTEGATR